MNLRLIAFLAAAAGASQSFSMGRLIVNGDEWSFSNDAFSQNFASTDRYVENVTARFGGTGDFLFATNNSFFVGSSVVSKMTNLGVNVSTMNSGTVDAAALSGYEAVFLAGAMGSSASEIAAIDAFLQGGGHVYIGAGTGAFGNAASEAAAWNQLTTQYGITIGDSWISPPALVHVTTDASAEFLRQGVDNLTYGFGHALTVTSGATIAISGGPELAENIGMVAEAVPEPGTLLAVGAGLAALARRRRK